MKIFDQLIKFSKKFKNNVPDNLFFYLLSFGLPKIFDKLNTFSKKLKNNVPDNLPNESDSDDRTIKIWDKETGEFSISGETKTKSPIVNDPESKKTFNYIISNL